MLFLRPMLPAPFLSDFFAAAIEAITAIELSHCHYAA